MFASIRPALRSTNCPQTRDPHHGSPLCSFVAQSLSVTWSDVLAKGGGDVSRSLSDVSLCGFWQFGSFATGRAHQPKRERGYEEKTFGLSRTSK